MTVVRVTYTDGTKEEFKDAPQSRVFQTLACGVKTVARMEFKSFVIIGSGGPK